MDRRTFVKVASSTGLGAMLPFLPACKNQRLMEITDILENLTVLFQGDSITDVGRNRMAYYANQADGLGKGYPFHAATGLLGQYPNRNLKVYNRGVSGDKVFQMAQRWEEDCLMIKPDVLSILIGVNDFWHTLGLNYKGTVKTYETDYRKLLDRTKKRLPNVQLIIGEPFVLTDGSAIDKKKWIAFDEYRAVAKKIARDYEAEFVPYQSVFNTALEDAPASYWCPDGVHPSIAGNYIMTMAWLDAFMNIAGR